MNKITENFMKLRDEFPNLGDYIILAKVVSGKGYSKEIIAKLFTKLVPKDDYERADKSLLLKHLQKLS